jgi:hypothetical protein
MSGGGYSVGGIDLLHANRGLVPDNVLCSLGYQMAKFIMYDDARGAIQDALSQGNPGALPSISVVLGGGSVPNDPHNSATLNAGTFLGVGMVVTIPFASDHPSTADHIRDASVCVAIQTVVDAIADASLRASIQDTITQNLKLIADQFVEDAPHPWW